jgi:hypothetical protein
VKRRSARRMHRSTKPVCRENGKLDPHRAFA